MRELRERRGLLALERRRHARRQGAQFVRVLEAACLVLQLRFFAGDEFSVLQLAHEMAQIVGAPLGLSAARRELLDLARDPRERFVRRAHALREWRCTAEQIEDAALRFDIQQRLRLVLPMEVHQRAADLGEHAGGDRTAVHPRSPAAARRDLALEHHRSAIHLDAALVEQREQFAPPFGVEHAFHRRLVGARADEIGARALAEQQRQRADNDRFPRARLAGEHVEAAGERQREAVDDREVADAQFDEHG